MVCEKVAEVLANGSGDKHQVELLRAKSTKAKDIDGCDLLILASPTYGHGQLEQYFEKFLRGLGGVSLKCRRCAVIGLGDPKYDTDYHLESVKAIMDFLKEKEADIVCMPLRVSRCPLPLIESGYVGRWAEKLSEKLHE